MIPTVIIYQHMPYLVQLADCGEYPQGSGGVGDSAAIVFGWLNADELCIPALAGDHRDQ